MVLGQNIRHKISIASKAVTMVVGALKSPKKPTQPGSKTSQSVPPEGEGAQDQCLT